MQPLNNFKGNLNAVKKCSQYNIMWGRGRREESAKEYGYN